MRLEFAQRHGRMHRRTVVQDVQVALLEVDNPLPVAILYIGISNIPLFRYGPIEDRQFPWALQKVCSGIRSLDQSQSPPDSVAGDAPADRVKLRGEAVQLLADFRRVSSDRVPSAGPSHFFEVRVGSVPFGNHFHFAGPNNLECRIIPPHSPGRFRMVEFRHLIENFGFVFQGQKAVPAALWHIDHVPVCQPSRPPRSNL